MSLCLQSNIIVTGCFTILQKATQNANANKANIIIAIPISSPKHNVTFRLVNTQCVQQAYFFNF